MQVDAGEVRIEAEASGDAACPALLLIRGLGTQMCQWPDAFVDGLVAAGLRVIRFDNRDVGLSSKLDGRGVQGPAALEAALARGETPEIPYRLDDMARDAVAVLDAFGVRRAHVFGISMGGMIAQLLAIRHAERVASLASVMSSSGAPGLAPASPEAMAALMSRPDDPADRASVIEHGLRVRRVIGSPAWPDPDDVVRADLAAAYDRCYYPPGVARQLVAVGVAGSRAEALAGVTAPTLVVHGAADPLIPLDGGIDTARRIPGAKLEVIEGMGHDLPRALLPRLVDLVVAHVSAAGG